MRSPAFIIVDVEATHGDPLKGRIIELAAIVHDGVRELGRWNTLVNPRSPVPEFVQRLTGIRPHMLEDAPSFPTVARRLCADTQDRILVAHNVRYDMTALQSELVRTGLSCQPDTLCTERLSRRLLPQLQHHNLGGLCRHFGIVQGHRHHAAHDAQATLMLLLHLIGEFGEERVRAAVAPWRQEARA